MSELHDLSAAAREKIGALRSRVLRKANGALPYDYIVPNGVYEELWDWDAFFVCLHLISENRADGIYLKNWCLNFLGHTEPDGQTPGRIGRTSCRRFSSSSGQAPRQAHPPAADKVQYVN